MKESILRVEQLGKVYGKLEALQNISLSLQEGEILGVVGENGAGKSTLLSLLATVQKPSHGAIYFYGSDIAGQIGQYRENMGYVPQETSLFEELSGYENLCFFAKAQHVPKAEIPDRIAEICRVTEFEESDLKRPVAKYSGGMKRKINIGAALMHRPKLLLLDEPTANLDLSAEEQVILALKRLAAGGTAIVCTGHHMEQMEQLCDKISFIKNGEQVLYGSMKELLFGESEKRTLRQLWKETVGKVSDKE